MADQLAALKLTRRLPRHRQRAVTIPSREHALLPFLREASGAGETGRCLLIDEAHRLHPDAIELLRDIHDETGCPVVLAGTVKLNDVVADQGLFFGQLSSRVALRYNLADDLQATGGDGGPRPLHTLEEIRQLYESDKLRLTDEGRLLLQRIANLPGFGGLRLCAKIMAVAGALGRDEPVDAATLLQILRTLHGRGQTAAQIERAIAKAEAQAAAFGSKGNPMSNSQDTQQAIDALEEFGRALLGLAAACKVSAAARKCSTDWMTSGACETRRAGRSAAPADRPRRRALGPACHNQDRRHREQAG